MSTIQVSVNTELILGQATLTVFMRTGRGHGATASVTSVHLQTEQASLPSAEPYNEMPWVSCQALHLYQQNRRMLLAKAPRVLPTTGQPAPRGSHCIMQWRRGPAVPTFIPLNSPASAPALPFCLPRILLRHCCCCTGMVILVL